MTTALDSVLNPPSVLPEKWFGADFDNYVSQNGNALRGDTLLIATGQESLTPGHGDPADAPNDPIPVGTMLFALRDEMANGAVRCGYHKDYYATIPTTQGLIWAKAAIRMRPVDPGQVRVGDLIARRAHFPNQGAVVALVTNVISAHATRVCVYEADPSAGVMRRSNNGLVLWDLADDRPVEANPTKKLVRASVWTHLHPLSEREDTTMATITEASQEKDNVIAGLRTQLDQARQAHRQDIATIGDAIWTEADNRDWCDEVTEFVEGVNESLDVKLRIPSKDYKVSVKVVGQTTVIVAECGLSIDIDVRWRAMGDITVSARTAEGAREKVEESEDLATDNMSDMDFEVMEVESGEVDDEFQLIRHLGSVIGAYDVESVDVTQVVER